MSDSNLLELLEMYIDMVEKQDEAIHQLSKLIKRQACEIAHMRNLYGFSEENPREELEDLAGVALKKYNEVKDLDP